MSLGTSVKVSAACAAGLLTITVAGCGNAGGDAGDDGVQVVTGVYPLEWLAGQVGGDHVSVRNLTEPGAEPHDLELSPQQVGEVSDADVAFFISGLQPAVDDAVQQAGGDNALDVADLVELRDTGGEGEEHGHGEGHEHGEEHEHGTKDPHMWLDTARMATTADGLADRLAKVDPDNADAYRSNAERVRTELEKIDGEYESTLASCDSREMVTNHAAFGYLAARYDLEQIGISGLNPDAAPSPGHMAKVADLVREHDISTIYTETLASPKVAKTIAKETGATTAVLDPIAGITEKSPGDDYPSVMRANLKALDKGLGCS